MKSTKRLALVLYCLLQSTLASAQPVIVAPDTTATLPAVVAPLERPSAADESFARLLSRLDNAPVNLDAAARTARHGTQMQNASASFVRTLEPVTPLLEGLANNQMLTALGKVPVASNPAQSAQYTLQAIAGLNRGFARLVELDRQHVQPLREAAMAADRLKRSRDRRDLAATIIAFFAAQQQLQYHAGILRQQRRSLLQTNASLQALHGYLPRLGRVQAPSPAMLNGGVNVVLGAIDLRLAQLSDLEQFTAACASDGQLALGS